MTQAEKLALRLSQFPGRLVRVMAFVDASGALAFWVIDEDKKIEGANGSTQPPQQQYKIDCEKKNTTTS